MEKIIAIKEAFREHDGSIMEGFEIITDRQAIFLGIANYQCCCESFGYLMSEDNLNDFIGSKLLSIRLVDTELKVNEIYSEKIEDIIDSSGNLMFVNIETNKGLLQFVAYNIHNGYYGHQVIVESEQLKHYDYL